MLANAASAAIEYRSHSLQVRDDGSVAVNINLYNSGSATAEPFLVEVQAERYASLTITSPQTTCNPANLSNIHSIVSNFYGNSGTSVALFYRPGVLPAGRYNLYGVSTKAPDGTDGTGCCNVNSACESSQPFGWRTFITSFDVRSSSTNVRCGDAVCNAGENYGSCAQDCVSWCGDGYCDTVKNREYKDWCGDDCPNMPNPNPSVTPQVIQLLPPGQGGQDGITIFGALALVGLLLYWFLKLR